MNEGSGWRRRGAPDSPGGALRAVPHGLVPLRYPPRPAQRLAPPPVRSRSCSILRARSTVDFADLDMLQLLYRRITELMECV